LIGPLNSTDRPLAAPHRGRRPGRPAPPVLGVALGLLAAFALSLGAGCGQPSYGGARVPFPNRANDDGACSWTPNVCAALAEAGENRAALESVLTHYAAARDSAGLQAAEFLIGNMAGHAYATFGLFDSTGTEIELDVLAYPDYDSLITALEALEDQHGTLDFERKDIYFDLTEISAHLLIENIDLALAAWREKPWAQHLGFAPFSQYVLPYRGSGEPLESWRPHFLDRYAGLAERMDDPDDPIEAARHINEDLKSWFHFDPRYYLHPTDQGLSEMLATRLGRCEDMTNLTIYAMRANGLGVTSDYTPYWADTGNNHAWNAILDRSGQAIVFMGAEANPGSYQLHNKAAKVYRKTFARQAESLAMIKPDYEEVPPWLRGKNYRDVTADYQPVRDITVPLTRVVPDSVHFAYLCVFNSGEWGAIHWGRIEGGMATFDDMGTGIVYLPAYYANGRLEPAAPPFVLEATGLARRLFPAEDQRSPLRLHATTRRRQMESTEGVQAAFFHGGATYELFYWDHEWVSAGTRIAADGPLVFDHVPAGALYWLVEEDSRREERIFTYESNAQVWW